MLMPKQRRKSGPKPNPDSLRRSGYKINIYLPMDLALRLNSARGPESFNAYVTKAIEMRLKADAEGRR